VSVPRILVVDGTRSFGRQVAGLADSLPDYPKVFALARPPELSDVIASDGPFDVLLAGPGVMTHDGINQLVDLRRREPGMTILLAVSEDFPGTCRDLIRIGAIDLLDHPVDDDELLNSLNDALDLVANTKRQAVATLTPAGVAAGPKMAKVYTITSATGGCGKTFYATNFACFLARQTKERVCLLDLDLQFGEISTALRLQPRYTIFDALSQRDTDPDDLTVHLDEYLVMHKTGVEVLAAPRSPQEADQITPPQVTTIIEAIRGQFDHVVVDTPPQLSEVVLAAFDQSEVLLTMVTLDVPSVRNMSVFLGTLDRLKIPSDRVRVILNKAETGVGIDVAQVDKLVPQGLMSVIPYAKEVSRSINLGTPVLISAPGSEVSRQLASGMNQLLPEGFRPAVPEAPVSARRGLMARFGRRSRALAS
jgi:pilus assembly protein CpaE